jgi:hypothetical protein
MEPARGAEETWRLVHRMMARTATRGELVTSVTTVKTMISFTGNDLLFVINRPGVGPLTERPEDELGHVTWA